MADARALGYDVQPLGKIPDVLLLRGPREQILAFAAEQAVERVSTDAVVRAEATKAASPIQNNLLLETLGVSKQQPVGRQVGVAIIDSGIAPSSDFAGRPLFFDFTVADALGNYVAPVPSLAYDDYKGRIAIGRLSSGKLFKAQEVARITTDGDQFKGRLTGVFTHLGLTRVEQPAVHLGDGGEVHRTAESA